LTTTIRQAAPSDLGDLATMHHLLWPEATREKHRKELDPILRSGRYGTMPMAIFISEDRHNTVTGFVEVGIRSHADGCDIACPVGFIEGWFVHENFRRQGIGRALMRSAEQWAQEQGCTEIASDTWIEDDRSQRAHQALGFEIVDRCVHFRKPLIQHSE
jgi:aminoglycoside 6'-N-acetyltransferase I